MIKRWFQDLITWAYVKFVFMPLLYEEMDLYEVKGMPLKPLDDVEMALAEKDHNTLQ